MKTDVLIVGAGSSGAALAARLSEDPSISILLLEAGADHPDQAAMPPDLLDSRGLGAMVHDWNYAAEARPGRSIPYRRGKLVGGTSAINAAAALWPRPQDMAAWSAHGASLWSWNKVQPALRRMEHDLDFPAPPHGTAGPLPIRRYRHDELIPFQDAFRRGCIELGMPEVADHNLPTGDGVGPWPMNRDGLVRMSTLLAYLAPARHRPNLTIRPGCLVDRVLLRDGRAEGVVLAGPHAGEEIHAGHVVLAAGAIGSPAILMRSGIGPASEIAAHGIPVRLDRAGVGARLWEHAAVHVRLVPRPGTCVPGRDPRFQMFARYTDSPSGPGDDMALNAVTFVDISGSGSLRAQAGVDVVAVIAAALMRPKGHGRTTLTSADPLAPPRIMLNLADDPDDLRRLTAGTRRAWQVAISEPMRAVTNGVVGLSQEDAGSDAALANYVLANVATFNHPCGTAPIGDQQDRLAVVDARGQVHGTTGLTVADASIIPAIPCAVINLTCIMIGERIAELMLAGQ